VRPPSRAPLNAPVLVATRRAEVHPSGAELAAAIGISRARLARLVRLGLVEPDAPWSSVFTAVAVGRLRRMLRLHGDLCVDLTGAAIIVDLVERLERLEAERACWRGGPPGPVEGHREL